VTKDEVLALLDKTLPNFPGGAVVLATCDGHRPHARAMGLVRDGLHFYVGTSRTSAKAKDITTHPQVEIVALLGLASGTGQLRIAGKAIEVKGKALHEAWTRARGYDVSQFMKGGLDDPGFAAFRIEPEKVLLMPPGSMNEEELPQAWFA
jgi:general stress protein 26